MKEPGRTSFQWDGARHNASDAVLLKNRESSHKNNEQAHFEKQGDSG